MSLVCRIVERKMEANFYLLLANCQLLLVVNVIKSSVTPLTRTEV